MIAARFHLLRDGDLVQRHDLIAHGQDLVDQIFVEDRFVPAVVELGDKLFELDRRGRELKAEACRVTPGHDRRA